MVSGFFIYENEAASRLAIVGPVKINISLKNPNRFIYVDFAEGICERALENFWHTRELYISVCEELRGAKVALKR